MKIFGGVPAALRAGLAARWQVARMAFANQPRALRLIWQTNPALTAGLTLLTC